MQCSNYALSTIAINMTTMAPTADVNQETGAQGGSGGNGGGGGAPPGHPPVLGPRKPSEQFTVHLVGVILKIININHLTQKE